jgi:hypothetical protein
MIDAATRSHAAPPDGNRRRSTLAVAPRPGLLGPDYVPPAMLESVRPRRSWIAGSASRSSRFCRSGSRAARNESRAILTRRAHRRRYHDAFALGLPGGPGHRSALARAVRCEWRRGYYLGVAVEMKGNATSHQPHWRRVRLHRRERRISDDGVACVVLVNQMPRKRRTTRGLPRRAVGCAAV